MNADTVTIAMERRRTKSSTLKRFVSNPLALGAAIVLLLIVLAVVLAPLLTAADPNQAALRDAMLPPGAPGHPLGTDAAGRDIWSRLLYGGRVSLLGAVLAVVVAALIGIPSGLLAGYYGGWFDSTAVWTTNLVQSMPGIVVLLAARAVLGPSIWIAMLIFGVILAPGFFRVVRTAVINVRNELYVDAARVAGLRDASIIGRHVLTVVRAPIILQVALLLGIALAIQSGLEFLGVGDNTIPSWGNMLNEGFRNIYRAPITILWPALAIGVTCAALVIVGNGLRDALEEREIRSTSKRRRLRAIAEAEPVIDTAPDAGERLVILDGDEVETPEVPELDTVRQTDALLQVRDVHVGYGHGPGAVEVVHGVTLEVRAGEVLGLVGESGSGKSQTAFAVLGLLPTGGHVTKGRILFDGEELTSKKPSAMQTLRGTGMAYIPQEPMSNLDPSFKIGTQLIGPMVRNLAISRKAAHMRAIELLDRVGIRDPKRTMGAYPHEISGGMAQRVLIAGAVSCNPRLLIADEPTTALDVTVQAEVLRLLRELQSESNMALIMVTHNFGVVADICDRVAVMSNGKIVETNGIEPLFASPQHPYSQMLLGSTLEGGPSRIELDAQEGLAR